MASVARANGADSVLSPDGTGKKCRFPMTISTGAAGQSRVYADGVLVATLGDVVSPHPITGCELDTQTLSIASSRVFACGRAVARIGDVYGDNTITSGSSRCFSG